MNHVFYGNMNILNKFDLLFTERQNKKQRTDAFDIPPPPENWAEKRMTNVRKQYVNQNREKTAADLIDGTYLLLLH